MIFRTVVFTLGLDGAGATLKNAHVAKAKFLLRAVQWMMW